VRGSFELNSAELTAGSRPVLARVAGDLKKYPKLRIEVQGHTDSSGRRRVSTSSQGVPAAQVEARSYGEAEPTADNASAEGRARNRRVSARPWRRSSATERRPPR